ncbi:hypothetical protein KM043_005918 [Ampulex compressa]|nr:hypothetical protein KM043_005918 [Ampulex compressa]
MKVPVYLLFVGNSITAGTYGLAIVFVMHARGQLRIATFWLQHLLGEEQKHRCMPQKQLSAIVRQHLRVLSFASNIENIMNVIALVELMGCTFLMCISGYCAIMEWNVTERESMLTFCGIFLSITFNVFVLCYIGETLSGEKTALCLILIILRSSSLVKMTAGKIIQLSLPTFMDVLKISLTYLNMLRALTTNVEL